MYIFIMSLQFKIYFSMDKLYKWFAPKQKGPDLSSETIDRAHSRLKDISTCNEHETRQVL